MMCFTIFTNRLLLPRLLFFILCLWIPSVSGASESESLFPSFPSITQNIEFWKNVYSVYSSNQGVIHDSEDFTRIYDVIPLIRYDDPSQQEINRIRIKTAKEKYQSILRKLSKRPVASTSEEKRILDLFGPGVTASDLHRAERQLRCQIGQRDRFLRGLIQSGAYIDEIKKVFRSYGLPQDLAYLPHVESSFNINAYSKFGAAGIWQFTRSTGKRFLTINYALDERLDVMKATHAAAQFLKENHEKLNNWPLALTAYNHGAAGMQRAKEQHQTYDKIYRHYNSRSFKFASKNFYSEFLAARQIAANPSQYFGNIALKSPQKLKYTTVKGQASIKALSKNLNVSIATIKRFNPALRPPVFTGHRHVPKGYVLKLPESAEIFETDETAFETALTSPIPTKSGGKKESLYTVRRGDTISSIARTHGIHPSDIIKANHLGKKGRIYTKQRLKIPYQAPKTVQAESSEEKSDRYIVQKGDTLASIARKHRVSLSHLMKLNNLRKRSVIHPNQSLIVPFGSLKALSPRKEYYIVRKGDTATSVAKKHDIPLSELMRINKLGSKASIYPNQRLLLEDAGNPAEIKTPEETSITQQAAVDSNTSDTVNQLTDTLLTVSDTPSDTRKEKSDDTAPAQTETPSVSNDTIPDDSPNAMMLLTEHLDIKVRPLVSKNEKKKTGIIKVQPEETLGQLAEWLKITKWELRKLNGISAGKEISINQTIRVSILKVSKEEFEKKRFTFHKKMEEEFFSAYKIESTVPYHVKSGDSAWKISRKIFQVPLWLIGRFNPDIDFSQLKQSQKIIVPLVEKLS